MSEQQPNPIAIKLKPRELSPGREIEPGEETFPGREQPVRIGVRGYLRLLRVATSVGTFGIRLLFNRRTWFRSSKTSSQLKHQEGAALREKLLSLGPTFIKIGQTLGTRADILPTEYIQELARLQDEVPTFSTEQARAIVEEELHAKIADLFETFPDQPVASASLGQVYRAKLRTGQVVAVKVQRPDIAGQIEFDITVLRRIARVLERYPNLIRGVDWQGTLDEFRSHISEELDYEQEARNAEVFQKNFARWKDVYVPRIHHLLSTRRIIVMEFIEGHKVSDVEQLVAAGHDPPLVV